VPSGSDSNASASSAERRTRASTSYWSLAKGAHDAADQRMSISVMVDAGFEPASDDSRPNRSW
jgi:hypothetical protein